MKKNIPMRIASLLLVAVLITSGAVSGTFAKYTAQATGSDSVQIAKWSFTVEGTDVAKTSTFTFDLFNTIKTTGGSSNEANVVANKIAPGTSGSYTIDVKNDSEVTAKYTITLSAINNPTNIPIQFSTDSSTWKTYNNLSITNNSLAISGAESHTIYWRWAIDTTNGNTTDTAAGTNSDANRTLSVTAKIAVEQVD